MATTLSADQIRHREETEGLASDVNVGEVERWLSGVGGAALIAQGLRRGSWAGASLALLGGALLYRGVTGHCDAYEALNVSTAGKTRIGGETHRGLLVRKTYTINRTPEECYRFWRDFENLPRFMRHLVAVQNRVGNRSHWVARAPVGTVEWDAEIINEKPNELIAWQSIEDSDIDHAGSVRFHPAPAGRGTEVTVELNYEPPAGHLGVSIAKLLGEEPERQIKEDLRHFKQIMEAGEVPTVEGQTSCRGCD